MENQTIYFKAVPVTERKPERICQVVCVLVDSRLPMMAMYTGFPNDEWRELNTQKTISTGITHWLERQVTNEQELEIYALREACEQWEAKCSDLQRDVNYLAGMAEGEDI